MAESSLGRSPSRICVEKNNCNSSTTVFNEQHSSIVVTALDSLERNVSLPKNVSESAPGESEQEIAPLEHSDQSSNCDSIEHESFNNGSTRDSKQEATSTSAASLFPSQTMIETGRGEVNFMDGPGKSRDDSSDDNEVKEEAESEETMDEEEGAYHLAEVAYGEEDGKASDNESGGKSATHTKGISHNRSRTRRDYYDGKFLNRQLMASDFIIKRTNTKEVSKVNGKLRYRNFECSICGYRTNQQRALLEHIHKHTGDKIHHCLHCNKTFRYRNTLMKHLKVLHTDMAKFSCKVCQRKFSQEGDCVRHELIHTGARPFSCQHCTYTSKTKGALKDHLRTHSGEKPYACDQCEYRSAYSTLLRQHRERLHLRQTYTCHLCDYSTHVTRNLNKHLKIHQFDQTFACSECDYSSNCKDNLKDHIRNRHTNKKMYNCTVCKSSFKLKASLNRHLNSHPSKVIKSSAI